MIRLAGFGDGPALWLVRGGHVWPSLDKYLGHLFVVQKASPDQHATATGHLCPVAKNALTRMGRLFRCGLPAPGFAHSRIVRRTATSFTASAVRMRGPQLASRISCGLGYSCLYLFAAWQKRCARRPRAVRRLVRRGCARSGNRFNRPGHEATRTGPTAFAQCARPGLWRLTCRRRHESPSRPPNGTIHSWPRAANSLAKTLET